jgi:hypothetical protein
MIEALRIGDCPIEDLFLDFTLPGYQLELKVRARSKLFSMFTISCHDIRISSLADQRSQ